MKATVDPKRCHGHARCIVFAPESFEFDELGYSHVREDNEDVKPEHEEAIRKAAANCPEKAIIISDES